MNTLQRLAVAGSTAALLVSGTASAEYSGDAVRVGLLTDMSGPYSPFAGQGAEVAARMAVEDFGSTINGVPLELLVADHQNRAEAAANRAREWVDREDVDVFLELINSAVALAVNEIARDHEKIVLVVGGGTTRLTNEECHRGMVHWAYDTYAMATGTANAIMDEGHDSWYFITADYAFGHALETDVTNVVESRGGEVVGGIRHPHPTTDFSSFVLQAQSSGADVIALANAGPDFSNAVRSANEFGITQGGQLVAGMITTLTDTHALGLDVAQGLYLTTGYYWDHDERTRDFANRFMERHGIMPNEFHAGVYSVLTNYLKAVEAAGTDERDAVMARMREEPINDFFARNGTLREDGRLVYDMYLARVKSPEESSGEWDYYDVVRTIPGENAYMPLSESKCHLVN